MSHMNRYNISNQDFYNQRKRKTTEDSYDDETKRLRYGSGSEASVTVEDEIETTLFKLGELNEHVNRVGRYSIESNIESAASNVLNQLHNKRNEIINILLECARLPEKLTLFSTLVGLVNVQNPNFIEEFIDNLATSLREFLKQSQFSAVHILVRFISDLVNVKVLSAKSVLNIYEKMVDLIQENNSPQIRTDFYIYCILSSIPWNGKILYEKHGPELDEILETIKNYIEKRHKDYLPLLKVWSIDDPHPQEDYLDCLWIQIKKLEDNDWKETQILRPYKSFETTLNNATVHDFPTIIPPEYNDKIVYPLPRVIFRMFDYTDVPEEFILPGCHSIERYLVEEQLHSVINTYYLDRKMCATRLIQLPITNRIPLNYMIVEIIFAQLFSLPKPPHIEIFYGSLLIELCKLQPNFIPQVLAQATELLYERIDYMKTSCIERFSSWFAYHLSNFQYKWSWEDWKECINEDIERPKNKFLRETLIRCMRLSYHQRIVDFLPESMNKLIPANPKPTYKYVSEEAADLEGTPVANKLLELFKERAIPEDTFQVLRDIPDKYNEADNEYETFNPLKIEVFTSTLLFFGCKSFSHAFAALAKYHMIFKMLVDNESSQLVVLKSVHDVWKNHQQMVVVLVDKMLKTQIVECSSVAKWIFSDDMKADLTSFYVWEILHSTINRMNKQVDKVRHEYNQLTDKSKKSSLDTEESQYDVSEEEIEQKLSTLQALQTQQKSLFFIVIEKFFMRLNEYFANSEVKNEDGSENKDLNWLKWSTERFEDFLLLHCEEILPYLDDIKTEFLTGKTHRHFTKLFKMYTFFKK